ncbi:hypothetical protein [Candidatus Accumulibacter sp. ACC012]|uniref:P-loop ATPase, Sll1717 family n=1 Tax=Candidatus Accumulibacter sp. ACC012 TaxID=2823332 RepID=UPI0025C44422|nr:hypothetical protein [Candidatus Accumulibacter sp. ACC012]
MPKLLETLVFQDNPFALYVAENEPDIDSYFVRPPYFDEVAVRGQACRSLVLFGARGAGKSATRLTFYKGCWALRQKDEPAPLAVALEDFSRITSGGLANADLGKFVAEVGYLTIEAVLLWLSALEEADRHLHLETMTSEQEALVIALVQRFYLSRPELVRSASVREPLKLLNQAWHKRTKLWIEKRWDAVAGLVSTIASAITKKASGIDANIDAGLRDLLKTDVAQWNDNQFARALLSRFSDFAKVFGFLGVVVLVDKVDETPLTSNSAAATAGLLFPLLSTTQLLEVDNFGWVFFLWDKVKESYTGTEQAVRLDKIAHATIIWQEPFLRNMIGRRLAHFSGERITQFEGLCDPALDAPAKLGDMISLCMKSPRELIRILDTVVREHDEHFANQASPPLIVKESVDRALDKYTVETLPQLYARLPLQQIVRMNSMVFTNKDVQNKFRINGQSARNRIRVWEDAGIVALTGTRPAEGGQAGKPANEYSIVDQRIHRLLQRKLSLGPKFDLADDDILEDQV